MMLHSIILDDLSVVEQVAVFQSVMVDAGISFVNLVPAFVRRESEFASLAPPTVQTQLFEVRWAITAMVARYTELRRAQATLAPAISQSPAFAPRPRTVEGREANPYAMRKASSVISSSDWSQLRLQERAAQPPAHTQVQPAFGSVQPAFMAPTPAFVPPVAFPNPAYPSQRPPTVDVPMKQAPDYFPGQEPAHVVAQPAFGMPEHAREPAYPAQGWQVPSGHAPPAYARPFIPFNSLEKLAGTEPLADRRVWWEEYKYLARAGSWTDMEKCEYLRMYLTKSARLWYKQLFVKLGAHRLTWKKLAAAFKDEFLESNESAFEKYCYLSQAKNETARQYLWRLNVAAKEASISIREPVAVERHVTRFVSPQVRSLLLGASFATIEQLEMQLRLYERRSQLSRDDGTHRDRSGSKARETRRRTSPSISCAQKRSTNPTKKASSSVEGQCSSMVWTSTTLTHTCQPGRRTRSQPKGQRSSIAVCHRSGRPSLAQSQSGLADQHSQLVRHLAGSTVTLLLAASLPRTPTRASRVVSLATGRMSASSPPHS
ncbi:hypothetical protein PINS_up008433 [Pythium insidiosum]|nr:hypothetical protein PINS_up008433 [Pythium insidiosum]